MMVACTLYHVHIHIVHKVSHLRHVLDNMYLVSWSFSILRKGKNVDIEQTEQNNHYSKVT